MIGLPVTLIEEIYSLFSSRASNNLALGLIYSNYSVLMISKVIISLLIAIGVMAGFDVYRLKMRMITKRELWIHVSAASVGAIVCGIMKILGRFFAMVIIPVAIYLSLKAQDLPANNFTIMVVRYQLSNSKASAYLDRIVPIISGILGAGGWYFGTIFTIQILHRIFK